MNIENDIRRKICEDLVLGMPIRRAANLQMLTAGMIRAEMKSDPSFAAEVRLAQAKCMHARLKTLEGATQWQAQTFLLESLWPEQFGRHRKPRAKSDHELPGEAGADRLARLTAEQRQQFDLLMSILDAPTPQTTVQQG